MIVRDNAPGDVDLLQNRNHPFRETSLGRKITVRGRIPPQELHVAFVNAQLHLECLVAQQWREGVVISKIGQVHARFAAGSRPRLRVLVRLIPIASIAQLSRCAEALNIFHQRARVVNLNTGFG